MEPDPRGLLEDLAKGLLGRAAHDVSKLAGDASTRSYWRLRFADGDAPATAVAMVMGEGTLPPDHDWLALQRLLAARGAPVPAVLAVAHEAGVALIEDLGDERLVDRLARADAAERMRLYEEAVDVMLAMQRADYAATGLANPAATRFFDAEKYTFEMNDFVDSYLIAHLGLDLGARREALDANLLVLSRYLATPTIPRVFTHRDYHARNLMATERGLRVVDFQDARMGPPEYDLASLLRDSYWTLEDAERAALLHRYCEAMGFVDDGSVKQKRAARAFRQRFAWSAMQRNLKAVGTFARLAKARGMTEYLDSIPPTLAYVRRALRDEASLLFLADVLGPLLPED